MQWLSVPRRSRIQPLDLLQILTICSKNQATQCLLMPNSNCRMSNATSVVQESFKTKHSGRNCYCSSSSKIELKEQLLLRLSDPISLHFGRVDEGGFHEGGLDALPLRSISHQQPKKEVLSSFVPEPSPPQPCPPQLFSVLTLTTTSVDVSWTTTGKAQERSNVRECAFSDAVLQTRQ